MENYYQAKKKLFDKSDNAVLNLDDEYGRRLTREIVGPYLTYSAYSDMADFTAKTIVPEADGSRFALVGNSKIGRVHFHTPGQYSISNALAAAVACLSVGVDFDTVVEGLNECAGVCGRAEVIAKTKDFTVIRDYAHSPDGLEKIITTLKEFAPGRVVTLFGCAGNRDRTKRPKMAATVARLSDFVVLTSDNPRDEDPMRIIQDALPGFAEYNTPYKVIADRYEAIGWTLKHCQKNDMVLLAGKGHEDYQVLDHGTVYFDEKVIVREMLRKEGLLQE